MFFDDLTSSRVDKYGFGKTAGEGRYHFMASLDNGNKIRQLCLSRQLDKGCLSGKPIEWFDTEFCAAQAFSNHKKACQKCLRTIETIELMLKNID